jgi:hypothetical protein
MYLVENLEGVLYLVESGEGVLYLVESGEIVLYMVESGEGVLYLVESGEGVLYLVESGEGVLPGGPAADDGGGHWELPVDSHQSHTEAHRHWSKKVGLHLNKNIIALWDISRGKCIFILITKLGSMVK